MAKIFAGTGGGNDDIRTVWSNDGSVTKQLRELVTSGGLKWKNQRGRFTCGSVLAANLPYRPLAAKAGSTAYGYFPAGGSPFGSLPASSAGEVLGLRFGAYTYETLTTGVFVTVWALETPTSLASVVGLVNLYDASMTSRNGGDVSSAAYNSNPNAALGFSYLSNGTNQILSSDVGQILSIDLTAP